MSDKKFATDKAFDIIEQGKTVFIIWRIQNFRLEKLQEAEYGTFHQGDAYVVYSAKENGTKGGLMNLKPRKPNNWLDIHIHCWLGSDCSFDKAAVAAIKSVELDAFLVNNAQKHQEIEGAESDTFRNYFPDGKFIVIKGKIGEGLKKASERPRKPQIRVGRGVALRRDSSRSTAESSVYGDGRPGSENFNQGFRYGQRSAYVREDGRPGSEYLNDGFQNNQRYSIMSSRSSIGSAYDNFDTSYYTPEKKTITPVTVPWRQKEMNSSNRIEGELAHYAQVEADKAFDDIDERYTCFIIWKIQKFNLVPMKREEYGTFYRGDAYLIYSASEEGTTGGVYEEPCVPNTRMNVRVHFWLGRECSIDESAVAAIKVVELCRWLKSNFVKYREIEGLESDEFKAYFPHGINVIKGGVGTGLRHVSDAFEPKLFEVKGKNNVAVRLLPKVSWSEMNDGGVYILETKNLVCVWSGKNSNVNERLQAANYAGKLKSHRGTVRSIVVIEDGKENTLPDEHKKNFDSALPLADKHVKGHTEAPTDELKHYTVAHELKLLRYTDESGTVKVFEVKKGTLRQRDLSSENCFLIDNGSEGIWVWIGKSTSSYKIRREAVNVANEYAARNGYDQDIRITRIVDRGEPLEFQTLFKDWKVVHQSVGFGKQATTSRTAKPEDLIKRSEESMARTKAKKAATTQILDEGKGHKKIWRIHGFNLEPVPESRHGEFFMGDCYIVQYTYTAENKENYIIYHWLGSSSSANERKNAAAAAEEMDKDGQAVIIRVVQENEPPNFLAMFDGLMVIYKSVKTFNFKGLTDGDVVEKQSYMLEVTGTDRHSTRAVEVDFRAGSLNSGHCFVIVSPQETFLWCHGTSIGDEREMAKKFVRTREDPKIILEGSEPKAFWDTLGGKEQYSRFRKLAYSTSEKQDPRLFQCSYTTGVLKFVKVPDVSQEYLTCDIMILDAWHTVFIWLADKKQKTESVNSDEILFDYLRSERSNRTIDTPVAVVKKGNEPTIFTGFFHMWDKDFKNPTQKNHEEVNYRHGNTSSHRGSLVVEATSKGYEGQNKSRPYSMFENKDVGQRIDPVCREDFMTDMEFLRAFRMTKAEFSELPQWKQNLLKQKVGMY